MPEISAINVPAVIDKFPVLKPVAVVVPIINLPSLSSNPIKALFSFPLSIIIPESLRGVPLVPVDSSIKLSWTVVLVVLIVVVVPLTAKSPVIVKLAKVGVPVNVPDSDAPLIVGVVKVLFVNVSIDEEVIKPAPLVSWLLFVGIVPVANLPSKSTVTEPNPDLPHDYSRGDALHDIRHGGADRDGRQYASQLEPCLSG